MVNNMKTDVGGGEMCMDTKLLTAVFVDQS